MANGYSAIIRMQIVVMSIIFTLSVAAFAQSATREANIYLQRTQTTRNGSTDDKLTPVRRMVDVREPLRGALEHLFGERITAEEVKDGFWSPTYGMKFEGVVLKNGTATVKFSQPPDKTNYGSLGPIIFGEAIEKTALQFQSVKRVKICAVGETMIDSELERPFPRCR